MNLLHADFDELYQRHLRRHSQYGINIYHLVSVAGFYTALLGMLLRATGSTAALAVFTVVYAALVLPNLRLGLAAAYLACVVACAAAARLLPSLAIWEYLPILVVCYLIQIGSHKIYTVQLDMSAFAAKYKKGPKLKLLLALYQIPILLWYLLFDRGRAAADLA